MPEDKRRTRRFAPGGRPARIDARRSFRRSLQPGGVIDLEFRSAVERACEIYADSKCPERFASTEFEGGHYFDGRAILDHLEVAFED